MSEIKFFLQKCSSNISKLSFHLVFLGNRRDRRPDLIFNIFCLSTWHNKLQESLTELSQKENGALRQAAVEALKRIQGREK